MWMHSIIWIRLFLVNEIDLNIKNLICVQHTKPSKKKYVLFSASDLKSRSISFNWANFLTQRLSSDIDFRNLQRNLYPKFVNTYLFCRLSCGFLLGKREVWMRFHSTHLGVEVFFPSFVFPLRMSIIWRYAVRDSFRKSDLDYAHWK